MKTNIEKKLDLEKEIKKLQEENRKLDAKIKSIANDLNGTIIETADRIDIKLKSIIADLNGIFNAKKQPRFKVGDRVIVNNKVKGKVEVGRIDGYDKVTKNYLVDTYDGTGVGYKILETDLKLDLLDDEERKFLTEIFKMRDVKYIAITTLRNTEHLIMSKSKSISINTTVGMLPYFKIGTMYKKLERNKPYSKEDLGL